MAQTGKQLDTGTAFPDVTMSVLDGSELSIPSERWTVFLLYRGEW